MSSFRQLIPILPSLAAALLLSCSTPASQPTINTYNLGERAQVGSLIYIIFDAKWMTQLGAGSDARIPGSRFFLVRMSVVNSGSTEATAPPLTITDDTGQTYSELTNGDGVPQWIGYLRHVKPAETMLGNVVFDAPPRRYKLHIAEENEEHKAVVDIPLTFAQEVPTELPVPDMLPPVRPGQPLPGKK
jgi:uncharacterized protein DUF4352